MKSLLPTTMSFLDSRRFDLSENYGMLKSISETNRKRTVEQSQKGADMTVQPWFADPKERERRLRENRNMECDALNRAISERSDLAVDGEPKAWGDRIELTYRIRRVNRTDGQNDLFFLSGPKIPMTRAELELHFRTQLAPHLE
jgi:hypothetical protein